MVAAIASAVHERLGFLPWRFDTSSYEAVPSSAPLTGPACATPWDPELAHAMTRRAARVGEELVLPDLLTDLAAGPSGRRRYGEGSQAL
ncbi:DUF2399 domain-containing protein [Planotetraspora sp. GP83]|uniref:DUF2399 domain-containing protein n=1 Tax=Planotetraspora sp. GP83 TaxID=3156264 RepID=UPI0035181647